MIADHLRVHIVPRSLFGALHDSGRHNLRDVAVEDRIDETAADDFDVVGVHFDLWSVFV